ncbi:MAG: PAC2 family protein [Candidatus Bathyarchaeia archaeon]
MIIEGKTKPREPILIEGLPGLGSVGRIVAQEIIRGLKARRIATLYSPTFPYYALVDSRGLVRLPRNEFYYWTSRSGEKEIIVVTGDCQPKTSMGQYEVANVIIEYAIRYSVKLIVTVGGYSSTKKNDGKVYGAATNIGLLKRLIELGVVVDRAGIPVVGVSGLILGLARPKRIDAVCLLGETASYTPDPKAAERVLTALVKLLGIEIDFTGIDSDISKVAEAELKIKQAEEKIDLALMGGIERRPLSYIS